MFMSIRVGRPYSLFLFLTFVCYIDMFRLGIVSIFF